MASKVQQIAQQPAETEEERILRECDEAELKASDAAVRATAHMIDELDLASKR